MQCKLEGVGVAVVETAVAGKVVVVVFAAAVEELACLALR